jgi:putative heme-binding domain-containing protein
MYGALYVVEDLDEYLTNAETYLAAHPVEIQDDLLKDRRPRTEWKLEDLAPAVATLEGRSYANGRHLFQVANCAACHRMDGVGNEFGPDLTRFDAKWTAVDVLKSILEPSEKIDEKYQTWVFELSNGKTASGLIVDENLEFVKIIENPLASTETVKLRIREIESRQKSPTSMMPKGVLDKLTRDEILDLIAYIAARGDKGSPIFGGDHHH